MNVLLLSTYDIGGGAARAAYRLHQGLKNQGIQSQMLVQEKFSDDPTVFGPRISLMQGMARARVSLDVLPLKVYPHWNRSTPFSTQWLPDRIATDVAKLEPDLVNLHWVGSGFSRIETLTRLKQPLVWTLHDMWPFTGGCHYSDDCDRYQQACGSCPALGGNRSQDITRWIWRRKRKALQTLNLTIVGLSSWLVQAARSSALFRDLRIEQIPNGLDLNLYRPMPREQARQLLRLPLDKKLILFGAIKATSEKRKGFHLLQPALQQLSQNGWQDRAELLILGASRPDRLPELGLNMHYLGTLQDDLTLALVYAAADVVVLPSIQDNLPNVLMEAIACGIPCVAFRTGGVPDLIVHEWNGYIAQSFQIDDLAQGLAWVLENDERHRQLSINARQKAERDYASEIQAQRYRSLFEDLLTAPVKPAVG